VGHQLLVSSQPVIAPAKVLGRPEPALTFKQKND